MESDFIKSFSYVENFPDTPEWKTRIGHVSASALKNLKISPAHFLEPEKVEPTPAMAFGSAYHTYILQPELFDKEYFVFDERDIIEKLIGEGAKSPRATNAYKEWKDAQFSFAQGKTMIDLETMDKLQKMKKRLMDHLYTRQLLSDGEPEKSFYCTIETFEGDSINVTMRTDFLKYKKRAIIELKTAIDASKDEFPKACANFDYQIQAAIYTDFMELITGKEFPWTFIYIVQESRSPYAFNLFEASPQYLAQGKYEYEQLMMLYAYCRKENRWPGYQVWCQNRFGINQLDLPKWAIRDLTYYTHENGK